MLAFYVFIEIPAFGRTIKIIVCALAGLVDVSMIMTALTLGHCATKGDAHKDLEDQMEDILDLVDLVDLL